ncbi:hypothetical protein [Vibrio sp. vnigr-6D03]|uniref:hypothetical protein n=1 Tax=Vibrio sp. vnigr-6D03 TaxID=2058088 RepID=UPI0015E13990|nr:hypothetical protein [Vibrio sp. vnigr-6D03]
MKKAPYKGAFYIGYTGVLMELLFALVSQLLFSQIKLTNIKLCQIVAFFARMMIFTIDIIMAS